MASSSAGWLDAFVKSMPRLLKGVNKVQLVLQGSGCQVLAAD